MAIKPNCDMCKAELSDFGAIILGPPNEENKVKKFHLCSDCYKEVEDKLK